MKANMMRACLCATLPNANGTYMYTTDTEKALLYVMPQSPQTQLQKFG